MNRRGFLTGLVSLIAAPAIVRAESLMPVKSIKPDLFLNGVPIYFDEIVDVTRKAFLPRMFVHLYSGSPLLAALSEVEAA